MKNQLEVLKLWLVNLVAHKLRVRSWWTTELVELSHSAWTRVQSGSSMANHRPRVSSWWMTGQTPQVLSWSTMTGRLERKGSTLHKVSTQILAWIPRCPSSIQKPAWITICLNQLILWPEQLSGMECSSQSKKNHQLIKAKWVATHMTKENWLALAPII